MINKRFECTGIYTGMQIRISEIKKRIIVLFIDPTCKGGSCNDTEFYENESFNEVICKLCNQNCQKDL